MQSQGFATESPVDSLDQVTWKPFMTEQEAITYTKDSVYANITFTTVPARKHLRQLSRTDRY